MREGGPALPLAQVEDSGSAECALLCDGAYHSKATLADYWIGSSLARLLQADSNSGAGGRP